MPASANLLVHHTRHLGAPPAPATFRSFLMKIWLRFVCYLLLPLLLIPASLRGQGTGASVTGTLHDASGAVVTNSKIRAVNTDSGREWSTVSNDLGIYTIPAVPPGSYTLNVEAQG